MISDIVKLRAEAGNVTAVADRVSSLETVIKNMLVNSDTADKTVLTRELLRTGIFRPS